MSRFYVSPGTARNAHPGLRLDRFLDLEEPEWAELAQQKLDYGLYRLAYQRWERYWRTGAQESRLILRGRVKGRLALGLGAKGVHEVGLRLHHTYGTPLIPASGIKGVLSDSVPDKETRRFLFGSPESMGFAGFQDAWWIPEPHPPLALDVVTVHHPDYYAGKGVPPSDSDNPNPVHFLSIRGAFLFVADAPNESWKAYLEKLFTVTMEVHGVGAKTAAGYGRFQFGG